MSNDFWQTPEWLAVHFKNHFDPCPVNPPFDGLREKWKSPAYVNPPYSRGNIEIWVKKAIEEARGGGGRYFIIAC